MLDYCRLLSPALSVLCCLCFALPTPPARAAQSTAQAKCLEILPQLKVELNKLNNERLALKSYLDNAEANLLTLDSQLMELEAQNVRLRAELAAVSNSLTAAQTDYQATNAALVATRKELDRETRSKRIAIAVGTAVGAALFIAGSVGFGMAVTANR